MKLNKKLEIAINALQTLKGRQTATRTADLATEIGTTVNFLEQIMRNLRTAGLVASVRGPGGGYVLSSEKTVTAYDAARAVGKLSEGIDAGDMSVANQLRKSIVDAYLNTTI